MVYEPQLSHEDSRVGPHLSLWGNGKRRGSTLLQPVFSLVSIRTFQADNKQKTALNPTLMTQDFS